MAFLSFNFHEPSLSATKRVFNGDWRLEMKEENGLWRVETSERKRESDEETSFFFFFFNRGVF